MKIETKNKGIYHITLSRNELVVLGGFVRDRNAFSLLEAKVKCEILESLNG